MSIPCIPTEGLVSTKVHSIQYLFSSTDNGWTNSSDCDRGHGADFSGRGDRHRDQNPNLFPQRGPVSNQRLNESMHERNRSPVRLWHNGKLCETETRSDLVQRGRPGTQRSDNWRGQESGQWTHGTGYLHFSYFLFVIKNFAVPFMHSLSSFQYNK